MSTTFANNIRKLRNEKGLSQVELSELLHVTRSTVARWENGSRLPDAIMIYKIAQCLETDVNILLSSVVQSDDSPNIIIVDDRKIFLEGAMTILKEVLPEATIKGFTRPSEAVEYAKANRVALAFLDIEIGKTSGLELCRTLLTINPRTNVVYLTAHIEYSFNAWSTGASGFMLKPITPEGLQTQLNNLRYPFFGGGTCFRWEETYLNE